MCIWSFLLSDICQIINGHASLYIEYLSLQSPIILLAMIGCSIQYAKCISGFECTYQFAIVLSITSKTETYYFCDNDDALLTTDSTWNSERAYVVSPLRTHQILVQCPCFNGFHTIGLSKLTFQTNFYGGIFSHFFDNFNAFYWILNWDENVCDK